MRIGFLVALKENKLVFHILETNSGESLTCRKFKKSALVEGAHLNLLTLARGLWEEKPFPDLWPEQTPEVERSLCVCMCVFKRITRCVCVCFFQLGGFGEHDHVSLLFLHRLTSEQHPVSLTHLLT